MHSVFHGFPQKRIFILLLRMRLSRSRAKVVDRGNERAKVLSLRRRIRVCLRLLLRARLRSRRVVFCAGFSRLRELRGEMPCECTR